MADTVASITIQMRDQASPVLADVAEATREVSQEVRELGQTSGRADVAMGDFGDTAGRVGGDTARLAGAISLVSPEAATSAMAIADLADVVEVASGAMKTLGISMGSAMAVMGPVAIAVGALMAVYVTLNAELEETEALVKRQADTATQWQEATSKWKASVQDLNREFAIANGELDEMDATAQTRISTLREERQATEDLFKAEVARLSALSETGKMTMAEQSELRAAQRSLAAYRDTTEDLATTIDLLATKRKLERDAAEGERRANEGAAAAAAAAAKASAEQAAQAAAQADFEERLSAARVARLSEEAEAFDAMYSPAVDRAAEFLETFTAELGRIVPPAALTDLERLTVLQADLALAFSRGTIDLEDYTAQMELLAAAQNTVAAGQPDAGGSFNGEAVAAGISGGPQAGINALATAGPVGAIIAAIAGMVVGMEDTLKGFSDFHMEFSKTIGKLPEIIFGHLEETLTDSTKAAIEMVPAFVSSLAKALPGLLESIVAGLPEVFDTLIQSFLIDLPDAIIVLVETIVQEIPKLVVGIIGAIIDAIPHLVGAFIDQIVGQVVRIGDAMVELFTQIFSDIFGLGEGEGKTFNQGGIFDQIFTGKKEKANGTEGPGLFEEGGWFDQAGKDTAAWAGSFAIGSDYVHRTGMAFVHEGETITPATGASSGRAAAAGRSPMSGGGGGGVHVHLSGFAVGTVADFAAEINRVLGSAGRELAWAD